MSKLIGMNTTQEGITQMGGYDAYMDRAARHGVNVVRIHIPGSVRDVCDPTTILLTEECKRWIADLSAAATEHGIKLMPMPYFLHIYIWAQNPFGDKYTLPMDFIRDGIADAKELLSRLVEAFGDTVFVWELVNEMFMRNNAEMVFAEELIAHCQSISDAPATVSFAFPETVASERAAPVVEQSDVVIFHTYNAQNPENGMLWFGSREKDLWQRLQQRRENVQAIADLVKPHVQGKPWFVSEDPLLPVLGPVGDFFARILGRPRMDDYREHFRDVLRAWVDNGAMMHGIMWSCCRGDLPEEYLEELKSFSEEE